MQSWVTITLTVIVIKSPLIYQWYSPDSSDTTDIGDMTPGGYTGVWCNLPATGVINCMITGKPQTGKPGRLYAKESRCSIIWFKLN